MKARNINENCSICKKQLNTWDAKLNKALAYSNHICENCIANEYGIEVEVLRRKMESFFGIRPCIGI